MSSRKKVNNKTKKKNAVVPCTDANQRVREHAARKKHEIEVLQRKLEELKEKARIEREEKERAAGETSTTAET